MKKVWPLTKKTLLENLGKPLQQKLKDRARIVGVWQLTIEFKCTVPQIKLISSNITSISNNI